MLEHLLSECWALGSISSPQNNKQKLKSLGFMVQAGNAASCSVVWESPSYVSPFPALIPHTFFPSVLYEHAKMGLLRNVRMLSPLQPGVLRKLISN